MLGIKMAGGHKTISMLYSLEHKFALVIDFKMLDIILKCITRTMTLSAVLCKTIRFSENHAYFNCLITCVVRYPDQLRQCVGPDLDLNCLTLLWYS